MVEMAKILNCSVIDFYADEDDIEPVAIAADEDEQDIIRIFRSLSRRTKHEFMSMVYDFESREELEGDKDNTAAV